MGTGRILVVDDEVDFLRLMERILGRSGYEVFTASRALDGIDKLRECRPDLVLMDVMLPDMNGWEACRRMKKEGNTKVLILTVPARDGLRENIAYSGCDAFLEKPVYREKLLDAVEELLQQ